jgi:hypothetical protein
VIKLICDIGAERQEIICFTPREAHNLGALALERGCDCYAVHVDDQPPILCYAGSETAISDPYADLPRVAAGSLRLISLAAAEFVAHAACVLKRRGPLCTRRR